MSNLPDPWDYLEAHWPAVPVYLRVLGSESFRTARTKGGAVIYLHCDLTAVRRRVALARAIGHLEQAARRGQTPAQDEAGPVEWAARFLLPETKTVADALVDDDLREAAARFAVTVPLVLDRLNVATEDERVEVRTILAQARALD